MSGFPCSFPKSGVIKSWLSKISRGCLPSLQPEELLWAGPKRIASARFPDPNLDATDLHGFTCATEPFCFCSLTVKNNHVLDKRMNHSVISAGHKSH